MEPSSTSQPDPESPTNAENAPPDPGTTTPSHRGGARRLGEIGLVALLSAGLAAGGTWGVISATDDDGGGGAPAASSPASATSSESPQAATASNGSSSGTPDWNAVTDQVTPSVVAISVRSGNGGAQGSGVIIDDSGHVLTNHHVVAGAAEGGRIRVSLDNGKSYQATVTGTDPSTDLAVVTIQDPPQDLTPISIGSSKKLKVGDPVMAIGNPLGLAGTVTTGIVSALHRPVTTSTGEGGPRMPGSSQPVVTSAIQTSAAINPGNSGGALVDGSGRLVGINSSIASLGGGSGSSGNIGIGFAIPVHEAMWIAEQLIEDGEAQHAFLGVRPTTGTAQQGSATRTGAKVAGVVDGSAADEAGLQEGDLVIAVDDIPITSPESLVGLIHARRIDSTISIKILRDGQVQTVEATLGTAPSDRG